MEYMKKEQKPMPTPPIKNSPRIPRRWGFVNTLGLALLILLLITGTYSLFTTDTANVAKISLSELAQDVIAGNVTTLNQNSDQLIAEYKNGNVKQTNKEPDAAITDTLSRYGVTAAELNAVKINVEGPSGFSFWAEQLAPFIIPIIFIILFIWFLTRQMRGAGVQALSFGQSKARVIMPDDTKQ